MRRLSIVLLISMLLPPHLLFAAETLTRAEGLAIIWEPLKRPAEEVRETPFSDVSASHPDSLLITFTKARGIVDDDVIFRPDDPLTLSDALLWLLRTRNVDAWENIRADTLTDSITRYPLQVSPSDLAENPEIARERLTAIMQSLDESLKQELHTVSYYGEDFAGERTAFGEIFDPNALTAAHRTFPQHTLVTVTNQENGKSVTVRINDRGPYVAGRDMDLSRAAFGRITSLNHGVISNVTFERVGYAQYNAVSCSVARYQKRLGGTLLSPGIPTIVNKGTALTLTADHAFRMIQMRVPLRPPLRSKEWTNERTLSFDRVGTYVFVLAEKGGTRRRFRTRVVEQCTAQE